MLIINMFRLKHQPWIIGYTSNIIPILNHVRTNILIIWHLTLRLCTHIYMHQEKNVKHQETTHYRCSTRDSGTYVYVIACAWVAGTILFSFILFFGVSMWVRSSLWHNYGRSTPEHVWKFIVCESDERCLY